MSDSRDLIKQYGVEIEKDYINQIIKNNEYNDVIVAYYEQLAKKAPDKDKIKRKQDSMIDCNKIWVMDRYEKAKVKDFKKTNLCKDKFCNNCKKVKQASRMAKFIPLIRPHAENMYQLTLTIPNVKGKQLPDAIKKIFKSYGMLVRYLNGTKKIKGINFVPWGYKGSIRSLEITFKKDEYHPHLHALIVLEGKMSILKHKNAYSVDHLKKREERLFSDGEIIIQKIWYLLINGIKVTKSAIEELEIGYSCRLDKFRESDFIELFKYMTKATTEEDQTLSYKQFETLYYALMSVRQIQGYGCFFNLKDEEISQEEAVELYNAIIEELQKEESPVQTVESPSELLKDNEYTLISRKKIYKYLRKLDS